MCTEQTYNVSTGIEIRLLIATYEGLHGGTECSYTDGEVSFLRQVSHGFIYHLNVSPRSLPYVNNDTNNNERVPCA